MILIKIFLIDKTIIESKREGYIEFTGTITGHADKHSFHITSFPNDSSPLHITISTPSARYSIQEGAAAKVWISKLENKWAAIIICLLALIIFYNWNNNFRNNWGRPC